MATEPRTTQMKFKLESEGAGQLLELPDGRMVGLMKQSDGKLVLLAPADIKCYRLGDYTGNRADIDHRDVLGLLDDWNQLDNEAGTPLAALFTERGLD